MQNSHDGEEQERVVRGCCDLGERHCGDNANEQVFAVPCLCGRGCHESENRVGDRIRETAQESI